MARGLTFRCLVTKIVVVIWYVDSNDKLTNSKMYCNLMIHKMIAIGEFDKGSLSKLTNKLDIARTSSSEKEPNWAKSFTPYLLLKMSTVSIDCG